MDFRVRTLGGLAIERDGRPLAGGVSQPLRLAVLALLARAGTRGVTRDRILALLWPEAGEERARRALSQALYAIRQELGSDEIILGVQDLRLNPDLISSDIIEFESALSNGRLADAAVSYRGPFLDGFHLSGSPEFERWLEEERLELACRYTETLERLAVEASDRGDSLGAATWWRKLAGQDPLNSRVALGLMESLVAAGDRVGAIQHARVYGALIEDNPGIPLDSEIVAFAEQLRTEAAVPRTTPSAPLPVPTDSTEARASLHETGTLPHELTSFIGREHELAEIEQLIKDTRLLTLTGSGGCGKTRLAQAAAAATRDGFLDGVWWVELAPLADPQLVPQAVATALDIAEAPARSLTETIAEHLTGRSALLVLDNCEHLIASCSGLVEVLLRAAPGLRILTTSRQPLNIAGERTWSVPSLSLPDARNTPSPAMLEQSDAVRLFVDRAAAVTGTFTLTGENGSAVARICRRLDGIPLAIELAAARLRVLSVKQMSERLDDCFALLTSGVRTALPRHRTLRATMDWSYDLLTGQERGLFARLSVFAGGFTLPAVEAICVEDGTDPGETLDLMAQLVEKSLVVVEDEPDGTARYRLLEPVRQYAMEKLCQSGAEAAVRRRHAQYCSSVAAEGSPHLRGPGQAVWLGRLDREQDNLRIAMAWLLSRGEIQEAIELGWSLWLFWWMRAHFREGRRWMEEALAHGTPLSPLSRAQALFIAGTMADGQAHYEEAAPLLAESLQLFQQLENKQGIAFASGSAGFVAVAQGQRQQGIALLEQSRAHFLEIGERWGAALMLSFLGAVWRAGGNRARALDLAKRGLAESRVAGDTHGVGVALFVLAGIAQDAGDHGRAEELYAEGLERSSETGEDANTAYCLEGLAAVAAARGSVQRAARLWGAAEALLDRSHATAYIYTPDRSVYRRQVSDARARLGDGAFTVAWGEGKTMPLADAITYALAGDPAGRYGIPEMKANPHRLKRQPWRVAAAIGIFAVAIAAVFFARSEPPGAIVPGAVRRLVFGSGLELDPALAPDGRLLAFSAESGGTMRLFVKQVGEEREVALAENVPGIQRWPRWSPDGSEIAFQSGGTIYVVPALGGSARALVKPEKPEDWVAYPAWAPNRQELAYVQNWQIYIRPLDGGPSRRMAVSSEAAHSLSWSPDGKWIALVEGNPSFVFGSEPWGTGVNLGNAAPSSIWLVPAAGGDPVRVTSDSSLNTSPVWLPGARSLLFVSDRDGHRDVYQVNLDDRGRPRGPPARITAGLGAHTITLSADGSRLAYAIFGRTSNLHWLPLPEGDTVSASEARPLTAGTQAIEGVDVSPDGRWLAFDSDRNGNFDLFKMPAEGGDPVRLTSGPTDEFMSSWSPDGRQIAFYSFENGSRELRIISSDGGKPAGVAPRPRNQRFPGWSPDGRALVFGSAATGRMELYVTSKSQGERWIAPRRLTYGGGADGRWSPRGDAIAYVGSDGLWTVAPTGGAPRRVLRIDPATDPLPLLVQWSRDGRTLYYKAFDNRGRSSIWSLPATGGVPRLLVQFGDSAYRSTRPEFATDGRRLYFTLSEHRADIWIMEIAGAAD